MSLLPLALAAKGHKLTVTSVHDAPLTHRGRQQAAQLNQATKDTTQAVAELLVTSGLRRTLSTTVVGYPELRKRLEAEGKRIVVLPQLQEVNNLPCDTGSVRPPCIPDRIIVAPPHANAAYIYRLAKS